MTAYERGQVDYLIGIKFNPFSCNSEEFSAYEDGWLDAYYNSEDL
jgi:hypothetical protein